MENPPPYIHCKSSAGGYRGIVLDYAGTYDDDRESALFRDTCWTEHVGIKTCNTMNFVPFWDWQNAYSPRKNLHLGRMWPTQSSRCPKFEARRRDSVADNRLQRLWPTNHQRVRRRSPSDLRGGPNKSTRLLTSLVADKGSGGRGRRKRRFPTGGWA